jgi:hypothetical protein
MNSIQDRIINEATKAGHGLSEALKKPTNMKTICAWCGKHLSGDPAAAIISHGICAVCEERQFDESAITR